MNFNYGLPISVLGLSTFSEDSLVRGRNLNPGICRKGSKDVSHYCNGR
jgi:hypothetical protein